MEPARQSLLPYCEGNRDFLSNLCEMDDSEERYVQSNITEVDGWQRSVRDWWVRWQPEAKDIPTQGWKLHISSTSEDSAKVCEIVWDYCMKSGIAFKFLRSSRALNFVNGPNAPRTACGKFCVIYPANEVQLTHAVKTLDKRLKAVSGPFVLGDIRIFDGPIYVRYGGFRELYCTDPDGNEVPAIVSPSGQLVPDLRQPVFSVPDWVKIPSVLQPHIDAIQSSSAVEMPFRIVGAIDFTTGGGVYRAVMGTDNTDVVVHEARPYAGVDREGNDAVERLRRQHEVLVKLRNVDGIPKPRGYHILWEHEFLVQESIPGKTLLEAAMEIYPLTRQVDPTPDQCNEYHSWLADKMEKVGAILNRIHAAGIRHGDIHPSNIMVCPDDTVAIIDFEYARSIDRSMPPVGALGFIPPEEVDGADADWYQFWCSYMYLMIMIELFPERSPHQWKHLISSCREIFPGSRRLAPMLQRNVGRHLDLTSTKDPASVLTTKDLSWPEIRDSIIKAILASSRPNDPEILFPGGQEQFEFGGHTFGYGAAGVLYSLHSVGFEVDPSHARWLFEAGVRNRSNRAGMYNGLHGTAFALHVLGYSTWAQEILEIARPIEKNTRTFEMLGGLTGIALNLLYFANEVGSKEYLDRAIAYADIISSNLPNTQNFVDLTQRHGLFWGSSGAAVLFVRLYEQTGDEHYLDLAHACITAEIKCGEFLTNGTFQLREKADYHRYVIYLDGGSSGLALASRLFLKHRPDLQIQKVVESIGLACRAAFVREPGLLRGRAGFIYSARKLELPNYEAIVSDHIHRLSWHAFPYVGGLAFPGRKLLRLSMDYARGNSGILLAINSAINDDTCRVVPHL